MRGATLPALVSLVALASGCNEGSPASPAFDGGGGGDATLRSDAEVFAVCPDAVDATFGSIYTLMLNTPSSQTGCGTSNPTTCHSTSGSKSTGSLLDYSLDASAVYAELLGDGGGHPAANVDDFSNHVLRVVPGDAGASLLYIKLTLDGSVPADGGPLIYGQGMPLSTPGSVCPAAVQAVADWINAGAPQFPAVVEAGSDGSPGPGDSGADSGEDGGDGGVDAGAGG
jgi:hypothetical protein